MKYILFIAGVILPLVLATPAGDMSPVLRREIDREFRGLVMRQATNLLTFTGALGGIAPPPITNSGDKTRPFTVEGNTFVGAVSSMLVLGVRGTVGNEMKGIGGCGWEEDERRRIWILRIKMKKGC
jgi:hypothetical protein